jgi:hypothetical protein
LFNASELKEYYDILKRRALAVLKEITEGGADAEVERLTADLVCYSKPKIYSGSQGAEIEFDRNFESLCLSLSEQLHIKPKGMTVLEFYNAFDFLQERARKAQKGR